MNLSSCSSQMFGHGNKKLATTAGLVEIRNNSGLGTVLQNVIPRPLSPVLYKSELGWKFCGAETHLSGLTAPPPLAGGSWSRDPAQSCSLHPLPAFFILCLHLDNSP